jgi:sulfatase maturation enzyme AslB (radical SAM superfamily)
LPFNSLELSPDGTCQVCCKVEKQIRKPDGSNFNLVRDSLTDIWNSDDLQNLRNKFIAGIEPEECSKCWLEEQTGNMSLRQQTEFTSFDTKNPKPTYVSLKLSNKCNLACRICGPHLSSLWEQEFRKTNRATGDDNYYTHVQDDKLTGANLQIFNDWARSFENVLIYGGEPLINEEVLRFLDLCSDSGYAKNMNLVLNTNGTICNDRILEKLSRFRHVNLFLSIDDTGPRFEYQRWPAKWERISANLKKFCSLNDPFEVKFWPTFSLLNIYYLKDILDELSVYGVSINLTNIIHEPATLALRNAPPLLKRELLSRMEKINFQEYNLDGKLDYRTIFTKNLDLPVSDQFRDVKKWHRSFEHQIGSSDQYRNQSFHTFFPELAQLISEDMRSTHE